VRQLAERIEFLETYALPLQRKADSDPDGFMELIDAGRVFHHEMLVVTHGELDARYVDRRRMNKWSVAAAGIRRQNIITLHKLSQS
jgi:hypothetical protein